ncbi:MAG: hypothetical protein NVS3B20_17570 [Polyangiales bacterium]
MSRGSTPIRSGAAVELPYEPTFELADDETREIDEAIAEVDRDEHVDAWEFLSKLRAQP